MAMYILKVHQRCTHYSQHTVDFVIWVKLCSIDLMCSNLLRLAWQMKDEKILNHKMTDSYFRRHNFQRYFCCKILLPRQTTCYSLVLDFPTNYLLIKISPLSINNFLWSGSSNKSFEFNRFARWDQNEIWTTNRLSSLFEGLNNFMDQDI